MNDTDKNKYSIIWDCPRMAYIRPRIPILMETMVVFSEVRMYHVQTNAFSYLYLYLSLSLFAYIYIWGLPPFAGQALTVIKAYFLSN
jgi:hypothetical protein